MLHEPGMVAHEEDTVVESLEGGVRLILVLMGCIGRLTPERRALVDRGYVEARDAGKSDAESAAIVLALFTDAEKELPGVHPLGVLAKAKPARPSRATG